ncbi:MAG: carbon storage regulator CsrA [Anaerovoracaceae bacterium]
MLILTRKQGESFMLGDDIEICVSEINGDRIRIAIDAPKDVKILRKELVDAMNSNKEAADLSVASSEAISSFAGFAAKIKNKN